MAMEKICKSTDVYHMVTPKYMVSYMYFMGYVGQKSKYLLVSYTPFSV